MRRIYIKKADAKKHDLTMGCKVCNAINRNEPSAPHNGRCRTIIEARIMEEEPERYYKALEKIVEEESPALEAELYQLKREMTLSEGLFKDIANKVKKYASLVTKAIANFFKKIWEKFEKIVLGLVSEGIDSVLAAFGLEWEGSFSMKTPSW